MILLVILFLISGVYMFFCWLNINNPSKNPDLKKAKQYALYSWLLALMVVIITICVGVGIASTGGATAAMAVGRTHLSTVSLIALIIAAIAAFTMGILAAITASYISKSGFRQDQGKNQKAYTYAVIGAIAGIGGVALLVIGYIALILVRHAKEKKAAQKSKAELDAAIENFKTAKAAKNT